MLGPLLSDVYKTTFNQSVKIRFSTSVRNYPLRNIMLSKKGLQIGDRRNTSHCRGLMGPSEKYPKLPNVFLQWLASGGLCRRGGGGTARGAGELVGTHLPQTDKPGGDAHVRVI